MLALIQARTAEGDERFMRTLAGLAALLAQRPEVADAGHDALIEPWVEVCRTLIARSVARGEASKAVDIEAVAQVIPAMSGYRMLIQRRPFERAFFTDLLDHVLLPALGID